MKRVFLQALIFFLISFLEVLFSKDQSVAEWTILTYMQADNNLSLYAHTNFAGMQRIAKTDAVNILTYWHQPKNSLINRFKVDVQQKIEFDSLVLASPRNAEMEIVEAMRWAHQNFPAKKYMLVLWNHGTGIIDKKDYRHDSWMFFENPWLEVPGLNVFQDRGILYSDSTKTCLNNQQLRNALKIISEEILKKKIDIIGMDACFMAMLEVAYQIKEYADLLVGSQNPEPGEGWNYAGFLKPLTENPYEFTPRLLAKKITTVFEERYKKNFSFYTQSTIDLARIQGLKNNVDNVVKKLELCKKMRPKLISRAVQRARKLAVKCESQDFLDLYSFYQQLLVATKPSKKKFADTSYGKVVQQLHNLLHNGMAKIDNAVCINVVGKSMRNAHGISIYFPQYSIHDSYLKTLFAQESDWLRFLKDIID